MESGERFISVILRHELGGALLEGAHVGGGPPGGELAGAIIFRALIVEMMAHLMADHRADRAVIHRRIGVGIEEGRLEDRGGESDRDERGVGLGVHRHRREAPFPAIDGLAELVPIIVERPLIGAQLVAEGVARGDGERRIIAPLARIADARGESGELGVGLHLGRGRHPGELVDALVHRLDDVLHQHVHRRLGRGREIFGDVDFGDFVGHRRRGPIDRALPAVALLRRAAQGGAVKSEILGVERLGQHIGEFVERAHQQLILEHRERRVGDQLGLARDRARLADDERLGRIAVRFHQRDEIEARRHRLQIGERHFVIGLVGVATADIVPMRLGDRGFERDDRRSARLGVAFAGKGQHLRQMRLIFRLGFNELGIVAEIIVAVGHPQPALAELERIGIGVLLIRPHPARERPIDPVARGARQQLDIGRFVVHRLDLGEPGLDRREPLGVDRGGIEISGISGADLAVRPRRLEQAARALLREILQRVERAEAGFVGGDLGALFPPTIGEHVEIVAGLDRAVHARLVEAEHADRRLRQRRRDRDPRDERHRRYHHAMPNPHFHSPDFTDRSNRLPAPSRRRKEKRAAPRPPFVHQIRTRASEAR